MKKFTLFNFLLLLLIIPSCKKSSNAPIDNAVGVYNGMAYDRDQNGVILDSFTASVQVYKINPTLINLGNVAINGNANLTVQNYMNVNNQNGVLYLTTNKLYDDSVGQITPGSYAPYVTNGDTGAYSVPAPYCGSLNTNTSRLQYTIRLWYDYAPNYAVVYESFSGTK